MTTVWMGEKKLFKPLSSLNYLSIPETDMCLPAAVKASIDASFPKHPKIALSTLTRDGRYKRAFGTPIEYFTKGVNAELRKKGLEIREKLGDSAELRLIENLLHEDIRPVILMPLIQFLKWQNDPTLTIPEEAPPDDIQYHALTIVGIDDASVLVYDPSRKYAGADLNTENTYTRIPFPTLLRMWAKIFHWTMWPADIKKKQGKSQTHLGQY